MFLLGAIACTSAVGTVFEHTAMYQSWWFLTLLSLLLVNIVSCVVSKIKWLMKRPGMMLVHTSAIFIAVGALIGSVWGVKGFLWLDEGQKSSVFVANPRSDNPTEMPLGFSIGLDDFIFERYNSDPDPTILLRENGHKDIERVPGKEGTSRKVFGGAYTVEVLRIVPDFKMEQSSTDVTATIELTEPDSSRTVRVAAKEGHTETIFDGKYKVEVLRVIPDFRMDLDSRKIVSASDSYNNPAVQIKLTQGDQEETRWLFSMYPGVHMSANKLPIETKFIVEPGEAASTGPEIVSGSDRFDNPAALIKIVQGDKEETRWLFALHPNVHTKADQMPIEAQFHVNQGGPPKDYKSVLYIEKNGRRVAEKTIEVNHPLKYDGFTFYQSSYDQQTLTRTGLEVVKDPGVIVVYIGFAMLCIGMVIDLYPRSWSAAGNIVAAGSEVNK
ncbi:MAG: cytochrome c biogenesis protein ResB [Candidatus Hydrogenedentes bacterium]|nr:cytochrome c biogenesis protein ResB [Candidatus Hydrogenedentota bacterium]